MALVVRAATRADVPALAGMRVDFTREDGGGVAHTPQFDESFARIVGEGIESGRWVVAVGELEGQIVSHAFLGVIEKIPRPTRGSLAIGYLTNVYTRPEHRSAGIGAQVVEWVQRWAREREVELVVVWPSAESVEFYGRLGFVRPPDPLVWDSGVEE